MKAAKDLHASAKALYDRIGPHSVPSWEQLGDATRSVWLERAAATPIQPAAKAARKKGNKP